MAHAFPNATEARDVIPESNKANAQPGLFQEIEESGDLSRLSSAVDSGEAYKEWAGFVGLAWKADML